MEDNLGARSIITQKWKARQNYEAKVNKLRFKEDLNKR